MKKLLKFSKKKSIETNFIQKFLYILANPIATIAKKIGLTPNNLTLISFMFALLAFITLIKNNLYSFISLWFVSYILDYADGTLARMTNSVGKTALRHDHISDLLKISLIFLGFGLYYNDHIIWILTFSSAVFYLFYTVLNHQLNFIQKLAVNSSILLNKNKNKNYNEQFLKQKRLERKNQKKLILKYIPFLKKLILSFLNLILTIITINGHTLLIFFFIPLNYDFAIILLTYFIIITTFQSIRRAKVLNNLKKLKN